MNDQTAATLPEQEVKAFSWKNLLTTAIDGVTNIFGNSATAKTAVAQAEQRAKTTRTILIVLGGLAVGLLVFFGLRKK